MSTWDYERLIKVSQEHHHQKAIVGYALDELNALEQQLEEARQERNSFIDSYARKFPESRLAYARRAEAAEAALEAANRRAEENAAKAEHFKSNLTEIRRRARGWSADEATLEGIFNIAERAIEGTLLTPASNAEEGKDD